jgi:hypothetical protein
MPELVIEAALHRLGKRSTGLRNGFDLRRIELLAI